MKILKISFRIVLLFSATMVFSLIADSLPDFFGDWKCQGSLEIIPETYIYKGCNYGAEGFHDPSLHWGYRHWVFFMMGLCLSIVQVFDIINLTNKKDA
jgi:hypothetical protein